MTQPKKSVNVRVKLFSKEGVRCAFPHFFTPWANEGDDESKAKYQALIALDKEYDTALIKKVQAGVKEVVTEFWGKAAIKKIGKSIDSPLTDGEDKGKYEVLENYYTLSAKKSGTNKNGKDLPPPKMMALVDGQYMTPDHKDWDDDLMMTGRYCFIIDLYTSANANSRGDKVCVGLVSVLALPALEGDEDEVMPGFGAVESAVEDDFADFLEEVGAEAAIPSSAAEFEDDESDDDEDAEEEDLDDESEDDEDDLDEELDEDPEPEPVVAEDKPKRGRARKAAATTPKATRGRAKKPTGETEETDVSPRKTKRTRSTRTRTAK